MNYEQISLFGERDPLSMVCEYFKSTYASRSDWYKKHELKSYPLTFSEFILDCFSGYTGGTSPEAFRKEGWTQYGCSAKGIELWKHNGNEWESLLVKKSSILRAFGIQNDMSEQEDQYGL